MLISLLSLATDAGGAGWRCSPGRFPAVVFAALEAPLDSPIPDGQPTTLFGLTVRELVLVLGSAVVLGLLIFLWIALTHRRRRHHSNRHSSKPTYRAEKTPPQAPTHMKLRRRRRDHPENLPRNPTLGETGGLPPIRPEEPPPAASAEHS